MKNLPLTSPDGCTLSSAGLADQAGRVTRLLPSVASMEQSDNKLRVSFHDGVDRALARELVATERQCCSFLEIEYDAVARMLSIAAHDAQGTQVVRQLAELFEEER